MKRNPKQLTRILTKCVDTPLVSWVSGHRLEFLHFHRHCRGSISESAVPLRTPFLYSHWHVDSLAGPGQPSESDSEVQCQVQVVRVSVL